MKVQPEIFERMVADGLSLEAGAAHLQGLAFLFRHEREDSTVPARMVRTMMPMLDEPEPACAELVRAGYWRRHDTTYEVVADAEVVRQSLAAQHAKREKDRRAQRKARSSKATSTVDTADDAPDGSSATQASNQTSKSVDGPPLEQASGDTGWPTVVRPGFGGPRRRQT